MPLCQTLPPAPPSASAKPPAAPRSPCAGLLGRGRSRRDGHRPGAAVLAAAGATNNRALYERNYAWLFGVNVLVAALLLGVLLWMGVRLALRGASASASAAACWFKLAGHLRPGGRGAAVLLIYVVSYQFVHALRLKAGLT